MNSTTSTMTAMRIIVPNPMNMMAPFECRAARLPGGGPDFSYLVKAPLVAAQARMT
jgi:hypothetical protein